MSDTEPDAAEIRQAYRDCARYLSDIYHDLFEELTEVFDCVVTLSDHGELFGEHGVWKHDFGVFPELTHVPLSVWTGEDEVVRDDHVVSLLDVHATVLEQAGIASGVGQDLSGDVDSREYLTEYHGVPLEKKRQRLRESFSAEAFERYNSPKTGFAAPVDYYGWETLDGFDERGDISVDNPRERMEELVAALDRAEVEMDDVENIPGHVAQRLDDLGYV